MKTSHTMVKKTILIFKTKFAQKEYFQSKTGQMNITIEFSTFKLILEPCFIIIRQFYLSGLKLLKKDISLSNRTNEHHHRIQQIWISLGTKFHLKQTILIFGPNLAKNSIFSPEQKKFTSPSNSAYSSQSLCQIWSLKGSFDF